jgi:hypothetical protein
MNLIPLNIIKGGFFHTTKMVQSKCQQGGLTIFPGAIVPGAIVNGDPWWEYLEVKTNVL